MDGKQWQGRWVGLRGVVVGGCKLRREVVPAHSRIKWPLKYDR
jgi:hypothetical protein